MEKSRWIIPLASIADGDVVVVGGKAVGLGRLRRAGFRVPNGFCVTAQSYREHIGSVGQKEDALAGIRGQILAGNQQHETESMA